MPEKTPTRYDRIVEWLLNHPVVSVVTLLGAIVVAIGAVAGAVSDIGALVGLSGYEKKPQSKLDDRNYALSFNGKDAYLFIDNTNGGLDVKNEFTIEAWIKPESIVGPKNVGLIQATNNNLTGATKQGLDSGWMLTLDIDNFWGFIVHSDDESSKGAIINGLNDWEIDKWQHIACTYDGSFISIFKNGKRISRTPHAGKQVTKYTRIFIGTWAPSFKDGGFHGLIDEVRLWNISRTSTQIKGQMNAVVESTETGLIGIGISMKATETLPLTELFRQMMGCSAVLPVRRRGQHHRNGLHRIRLSTELQDNKMLHRSRRSRGFSMVNLFAATR